MNQDMERKTLIDKLQFLGQLSSTETALFHQTAAAKCGLGVTDMKTLSVLQQEGDMTAGQIASRLSLTTGAVTSIVDRLEQHDMIRRKKDAKDRRKVIVTLNPEALGKVDTIYRSMGEAFNKLLSNYSVEKLEFLVKYFESSIKITKEEIAKLASR